MINRRWLMNSIALCAVFSAVTNVAHADHAWGNYHWARTASPFTLKLGDNMSGSWKSYLAQTSSDWNSPELVGVGNSPILTAVAAGSAGRRCRAVAGTSQVCNGSYGKNGWLGLATIRISGDHITQGSAKMNDTYFSASPYNNPNEKLHVVCQEIAHTFGLDHQSEDGSSQNSCMDYFSNTGADAGSTLSTKPNAHDFDELNLIYAHLDSTTTLAASATQPSASNGVHHDDPKSWGIHRSQSANGRSSIYEMDHGNGNKTITHVLWTRETAARCPSCDHRYDHD